MLRSAVTTIADLHHAVERRRERGPARAGRRPSASATPEPAGARAAGHRDRRHGLHVPASPRPGDVLGERPGRRRRGHRGAAAALGHRRSTTTPKARASGRRRAGAGSCPRSPSTRCSTASRRRRWPASSRCSCWPWRPRTARSWTPGTATAPFDRARTSVVFGAEAGSDLSNAMTLRTVLPVLSGRTARRTGRAAAADHRGLVPGRAGQRHRRADRQPARPGRRELHRRRGVRVVAGRRRRRLQGADRRHQRPGPVRRRRPAQRHQRLPAVRLGARALADRPLARRSTARPTASRSAKASPASC